MTGRVNEHLRRAPVPIEQVRRQIQRQTTNIYDSLFTRRVSIHLTRALAAARVTPNAVSAVDAAVGIAACLLMAVGSPRIALVGVALLHLYAVLDSVDGELARLTRRFSLEGLFLEDLSAYTMINAFNLSIAWRLHTDAGLLWPLVGAVAVAAFGRNVMPVARRALLKSIATGRPHDTPPPEPARAPVSPFREFLRENVVHTTNQWVVLSALLALAVYRVTTFEPLAVLFAVTLAMFAARELVLLVLMLRANRLERELARIYRATSTAKEGESRDLSTYTPL